MAKFPPDLPPLFHYRNGRGDSGATSSPDIEALRNNDNFRSACARYQEELGAGHFDEEWLGQAFEAAERRRRGDFAAYELQKLQKEWILEEPVAVPSTPKRRYMSRGGAEDEDMAEDPAGLGVEVSAGSRTPTNIKVCNPSSPYGGGGKIKRKRVSVDANDSNKNHNESHPAPKKAKLVSGGAHGSDLEPESAMRVIHIDENYDDDEEM